MIWQLTRPDSQVIHYLFGTMHLGTKEAYTYVDDAKKYILLCNQYFGEMNLNESYGQNMEQYFLLPDGILFSSFFRAKKYQKICKTVNRSFGVNLKEYNRNTPFYINNMLADLCLERSNIQALDHYLWQFAMESQRQMNGVESFDDQIEILKQISFETQLKSFKDAIKNISSFRKKIKHLNRLYAQGDFNQLYQSSKRSMGKIRKLMIYDRNIKMVNKIVEFTQENASFFAIGAAHYPGGKGILALLQKQGYKIKQL